MSGKKRGSDASNKDSSTDPNYSDLSVNVSGPGPSSGTIPEQGVSPGKRAKTDESGTTATAERPGNVQPSLPAITGPVSTPTGNFDNFEYGQPSTSSPHLYRYHPGSDNTGTSAYPYHDARSDNGFSMSKEELRATVMQAVADATTDLTARIDSMADSFSAMQRFENSVMQRFEMLERLLRDQHEQSPRPTITIPGATSIPAATLSTPRGNFDNVAYGQPSTSSHPYRYHTGSDNTGTSAHPYHQARTDAAHSTRYPSATPSRSVPNPPFTSADYPSEDISASGSADGNSEAATSESPRPLLTLNDLENHVFARDLQTPVDTFVASLDYDLFYDTFSRIELNETSQTPNARRWDFAILAELSYLFTKLAIWKNPNPDDEQMTEVRKYLEQSPLPDLAVPIVSQLSVMVDRAQWNDRCSCQFFFFFHCLIILIGSLRNELRTRFFSDKCNQKLLKKVVQEIIHSMKEKCVDDMKEKNVAEEWYEYGQRQKRDVQNIEKKRNLDPLYYGEFLVPLQKTVHQGFDFVPLWKDFPAPDAIELVIGIINGVDNGDVNLKEQQGIGGRAADEKSQNNSRRLSEMISIFVEYLNVMTNGEEQDQEHLPRTTDLRILPSIDDRLKRLKAKKEKVDEEKHEDMNCIAKSACELIMTERSIQKGIFSTWKEDSKTVVENLFKNPENFTEAGQSSFEKLVDIFRILRLHDRYRFDAVTEGVNNYKLLLGSRDADRKMKLIIAILNTKRIDIVPELNSENTEQCGLDTYNKTITLANRSSTHIGELELHMSLSLQKPVNNIPPIAVLTVKYELDSRERSIHTRIDSALVTNALTIKAGEPEWPDLEDIAKNLAQKSLL